MRVLRLCLALGLASAARQPSFVPDEDDEELDPSANYRLLKSVQYHNVLKLAGRDPVVMAYLDNSEEDYDTYLKTFDRAAASFKCLPKGGAHLLPAGTDVRARFIVAEDEIAMPNASIFRGAKKVMFDGTWTEAGLRTWVYKQLAGITIIGDDPGYDAFTKTAAKTVVRRSAHKGTPPSSLQAHGGEWQVAFVDSYCSPPGAEFTKMIIEHRDRTKTQIPAAISANQELAKLLGMPSGTGLIVVEEHGKGVRTYFPESKLDWTAKDMQQWMLNILGKGYKFRALAHDEL